jgi:hypothetical protein
MAAFQEMTATSPLASRAQLGGLVELALASLPHYELAGEPGIFCYERRLGDPAQHGRSLRYTLMALLGLLKAREAGYEPSVSIEAIRAALDVQVDAPELDPGDYGLYLWADARAGRGRGADYVARLDAALAARGGLPARLGMEMGWIVTGLAEHVAAGGDEAAQRLLHRALDQLLGANRAPSGLFRHHGDAGLRRRFPNFATQIYAVLALATVARHGLHDAALPAAQAAADRLLALQLPDGGWPWLFDAERGTVVEPYEVYCVHQHAMAPMGLLELSAVSGDERYARAAVDGLGWIWGANELRRDMVEPEAHMVLRSIRRRRGADRLSLALRTGASLAGLPTRGARGRLTEVNPTDRPYSMGWILEAWCGREGAVEA